MSVHERPVTIAAAKRAITHVGFSDESSWNQNRFRSIGLVTAPKDIAEHVAMNISELLAISGVGEFAWNRLRDAKHRLAAEKVVDYVVKHSHKGALRMDVIIWDTHDSRHNVPFRDDTANLTRMYYHLISDTAKNRWPTDASWLYCVDERTDVDWDALQQCLAGRTRKERECSQGELVKRVIVAKCPQRSSKPVQAKTCWYKSPTSSLGWRRSLGTMQRPTAHGTLTNPANRRSSETKLAGDCRNPHQRSTKCLITSIQSDRHPSV